MEYSGQVQPYGREDGKRIRRRIGIMGGTFNPVHLGHVYMAQDALTEFALQSVLFIPTGTPPHKINETLADKEHRYAMLELAIQDTPQFGISRVELDRAGRTYTVDTLNLLHRAVEDAEFYFIIGADTLLELHTWKNFEQVMALTEFICFLRPGADSSLVRQYIAALDERFHKEILISEREGLNVSSREVREKIALGQSVCGLMDARVEKYIRDNGVYR